MRATCLVNLELDTVNCNVTSCCTEKAVFINDRLLLNVIQ